MKKTYIVTIEETEQIPPIDEAYEPYGAMGAFALVLLFGYIIGLI